MVSFSKRRRLLFVGGLHRSGTTLLTRCIGTHPQASCLQNTRVPEDEGQHLQDVYPTARSLGGPGQFGFSRGAHITENSRLVSQKARDRLLEAWAPFWRTSATLLVEKSPPNLLRSRFLHALFPAASFIVIVRHPVAVAAATRKWSRSGLISLIRHWAVCHALLLRDAREVPKLRIVRYEELVANPGQVLEAVFRFLELEPVRKLPKVHKELNERYFRWWDSLEPKAGSHAPLLEMEKCANAFGYSFSRLREMLPPARRVGRLLMQPNVR